MFTVNRNPDRAELGKFGWAMLIGFGGLAGLMGLIMIWRGVSAPRAILCGTLAVLGIALCILSHSSPRLAKPIYVGWMSAATAVGTVVSTILLTVMFVLLLPVFSVVARLSDPLRKKLKHEGTYWEEHKSHEPTLERLKRLF